MSGDATAARPEHLKRELKKLVLADFDIRCADALGATLEEHEMGISPLGYGLLTGMAVSYARPFVESRGGGLGVLGKRWRSFPGRPELKDHHNFLVALRNQVLAYSDETPVRLVVVFPAGTFSEGPLATEARSAVRAEGVGQSRELFAFQLGRMPEATGPLAQQLHSMGLIPDEGLEF